MPMNYAEYHPNFPARALALKEACGWICQGCGLPCRAPGESNASLAARVAMHRDPDAQGEELLALHSETHGEVREVPQRFVLTAHHPDHDKLNPEARLEILCSGCHLRADLPHHIANARKTRRRKRLERGQAALDLTEV